MLDMKRQFIERTFEVWQRRTSKELNVEDARQIAENVAGFFQILLEWEAAEQKTDHAGGACHAAGRCPQ